MKSLKITLTLFILVSIYMLGYITPKRAICELGTEVDITEIGEYPVYSIECRDAVNVQIILVD